MIELEHRGRVVLIRLNRPEARNALNTALMEGLVEALVPLDRDPEVGCFVLTGREDYFAAGADIKEMRQLSVPELMRTDFFAGWETFANLRTPKIAAVNGYALGGGCELAMMCDLILAADSARFGQPEITLGVMPGMGGTQRLTHLIGKAKAMDMILTGEPISAREAERAGLVSRVFSDGALLPESMAIAQTIASYGKTAVQAAREAVNRALQTSLQEGLLFERRAFHTLFATPDQREGMDAFIEKRPAVFNRSCG